MISFTNDWSLTLSKMQVIFILPRYIRDTGFDSGIVYDVGLNTPSE
jgi:hypothetical protein